MTPPQQAFEDNLASQLPDFLLTEIGMERLDYLRTLRESRSKWEKEIQSGMRLLGLFGDDPGDTRRGCTATHPLLLETVIKFQSKAIQELWPARGPVRTKVKGFVDEERLRVAQRVERHMNWQLTEQVPGFYNQLERNLFRVGFLGTGIRKVGWNANAMVPDPSIVCVENFFVDPAISHLKYAEEYIELMELTKRQFDNLCRSGTFYCADEEEIESLLPVNDITEAIQKAQGFEHFYDRRGFLVGEAHCYLDLQGYDSFAPDNGRKVPYVVHFNTLTGKVYSVRRNWTPGDQTFEKRLWYVVDTLIPAFGFYGLGFLHLLGGLTAAATAAMRQLVDAGEIANMPSGFKTKDARIVDGDRPLEFGEWRDVEMAAEDLAKAFFPLPAKEPSPTLYNLMDYMVKAGQRFADTTDMIVNNAANYGPVATTLALLEESQKFYSALHKRLHQSQHEFLNLLGRLNFENLPPVVNFVAGGDNSFVRNVDYNPDVVDVVPASDPNSRTESQRLARAQLELETAARFPQVHDVREAIRRFYLAAGADNIEKLLPDPEAEAVSADPLTEIQVAMKGKPIKAVVGQPHQEHIAVKMAFLMQPQMQGVNDPTVAVGIELLKANIAEHKTLMFVSQVIAAAQQMGLPPNDPKVQAQVAQFLLEQSAAAGGPPQPSIEERMLQLNAAELELANKRIDAQNVREAAKIAAKNKELALKELALMAELKEKEDKSRLQTAKVILDAATKGLKIEQERLGALANGGLRNVP